MVLRISAFMHGHSHPKLTKKLNDKIRKTVDEMFKRVRAFIKGEVAAWSAEMVCPSQGDKGNTRPTWTGGPEKARNRGGPREAQRNMGIARKGARFVEGGPVPLEKKWGRENTEEIFTISHECLNWYVPMGATLTSDCKQLSAGVLRENMEVFSWTGSERTGVPRFVMEHHLKMYPLAKPIVHKIRPMTPDGRQALKEKVFHWLKERIIRKYPIREARMRFKTAKGSGWTNKAEEALRRIKSKLSKLQTLAIPKDGEVLMLCLRQRNEIISSVLLEAERSVVKKLFSQGKQVEETPNANEEGMLNLSKKLQIKSTPTPRAWKFYLGRRKPHTNNGIGEEVQGRNYGCNGPIHRIGNYKFGLLNQEVSVGIKTRPSVEEASSSKKGKATSNVLGAKPNYNCEASGSN
ncbi:hypothetical protein Tco_0961063 [Tanacetum coccineum]